MHSHNLFSNYNNGSSRVPFDCGVSFAEQLERAYTNKIQALFITNHNTIEGYNQVIDYRDNHSKYRDLKIYPAEEITIDDGGHVLAYGITEEIKSAMSLEDTLDKIKSQNGISCAAHPFAVSNGIREKASLCDMIESFNSNNVDYFSNLMAFTFAKKHSLVTVAGSDSHIASTIGRCINFIEAENKLDDILESLKSGRTKIVKSEYVTKKELFEHAHYVLSNSKESILQYALENYPYLHKTANWALNSYISNPDRKLWKLLGSFGLYLTKRVSKKINLMGYDPKVLQKRSWRTLIGMSLIP